MFFDAESHKGGSCYIEIPVANLERAKKFYSVTLSVDFAKITEEYAVFHLGNMCVCLISEDSARAVQKVSTPGRGVLVYFNLRERLAGALKAVEMYKGTIVSDLEEVAGDVNRAIICDSEGNLISFYSVV